MTLVHLCVIPLFTCLCKTPDSRFSLRCSSSFFPYGNGLSTVISLIALCICLSQSTAFYSHAYPFHNDLLIISGGRKHFILTQWRSRLFLIIDTQIPRHTNTRELMASGLQLQPQVNKNLHIPSQQAWTYSSIWAHKQTNQWKWLTSWVLHHLSPSGEPSIDQELHMAKQ